MARPLIRVLRLLLIAVGVGIVLWAVTWQDAIRIPAGAVTPTAEIASVDTSVPVIGPAVPIEGDPDLVRVTLMNGDEFACPASWYRPGIASTFAGAWIGLLLLGLLPLAAVYPLQATRWWVLMRCRGLSVGWFKTLRLVFVGAFFNFCMPGTEGGDVVKAWYAARRSDRRVIAVMSVVFDRLTGLLGLITLAATAGVLASSDPTARTIGWWAWAIILLIVVFAWLYFTAGLRDWLGLKRLRSLFGGGLAIRVEEAVHAYGRHKAAVALAIGLSVIVQLLLASAATMAGVSLGISHDVGVILAVMPILFLAAAVPMSWQGVGVMEAMGILILAAPDLATPNQVIGMLLIYRGYELTWSLLGALFLLKGDIHLHPEAEPASAD
jgi:uncharacterized protein (TIRG00374 family)